MPTFYRVVKTDPPKEADFLSHKARGVVLRRDTPYYRRLAEGVSVSSYTLWGEPRDILERVISVAPL